MAFKKILIVEDSEIDATNIKYLLKKNNYAISDIVKTCDETLKSIERELPDLILMDIMLPGHIDGIEITKMISSRWDIPVIFLTSGDEVDILEKAKQTKAAAYLTKQSSLNAQLPIMIEFVLFKHSTEEDKEKARLSIHNSEEKFRSIASTAKDAIIFLNSDNRISFWNTSATKIFGFTNEEAENKKIHELIAPEPLKDYYKFGFNNQPSENNGSFLSKTFELQAIKKNGQIIPIELSLSPVELKGELCSCAIIRDISIRKESEEVMERLIQELQLSKDIIEKHSFDLMNLNQKLKKSEDELKQLNASKDKFFSIIAHDMKGLFQGLMAYAEILVADVETLTTEELKDYTNEIYDNSKNLLRLFENMLQWSRLQRGIIKYKPDVFELKQIIDLTASLFSVKAGSKQIELINNVQSDLFVLADINMVNTIIRNLISNSMKFTNPGGRITLSATLQNDSTVQVSIHDTGIGISEENIGELFNIEKYHSTPGTDNEKGTGLGLILCKELIEMNKGKIWAESKVGEGSTFYFTLPSKKENI